MHTVKVEKQDHDWMIALYTMTQIMRISTEYTPSSLWYTEITHNYTRITIVNVCTGS